MQHTTSDFILAIHDASMYLSPAEFHRWALKEIRQYIDFDFAIWGGGNGQSRQLHMATVLDQVDTFFETWESIKHEDPYADLVIGNTGKTWSIEELPDFRHSQAYSEHWGRYCARQMVSTMEVDPQTGLHIFVTLARENQQCPFNELEARVKNMITQHLFLASRHNDMHYLRANQAPAAFVDQRGLFHASLPEFCALLVTEWGRQASQRLPEAVNHALWQTGRYQSRHISLNAQQFNNRLLVRAAMTPSAILSPREEEIAWMYAEGNSHKQVAQALAISPTTVRTHLARIYQKLNISDKGSLAIWLKENQDTAQYDDAGRGELADKERAEMAIIEEFMPAALSEEELDGLIAEAIRSTGAQGMQDMGNVMNELRPKVTGRVDMGQLSKKVRAALAG